MASTEQLPRVLVLGSTDHPPDVDAFAWNAIPPSLNILEYDVVVMNFVALDEDTTLPERVDTSTLPSQRDFARFLFAPGSSMLVIGHPGSRLGDGADACWWLPCTLKVEHEAGSRHTTTGDEFTWWFEQVRSWRWLFTGKYAMQRHHGTAYVQALDGMAAGVQPVLRALATTRDGRPVGLEITLVTLGVHQGSFIARSGPVYWLPQLTGRSSAEMVDQILARELNIAAGARQPKWSWQYVLPDHQPKVVALLEALEARRAAEQRVTDTRREERQAARFQQLLYEHDHPLEPIIHEALTALGGDVHKRNRTDLEDGRVQDPSGRRYMLEVKSTKTQVTVENLRQVAHWVTLGKTDEDEPWDSRPLLVINVHREKPPPERGPALLTNTARHANSLDVAVLTTTQLFQALADHQAGRLNVSVFWDAIATAAGAVDLPELQAPNGPPPHGEMSLAGDAAAP